MRRIYVYSGSICLLVLSLWFGWWVFALVGVVLLVVNRYGYAAALVAGAGDLLWGQPVGVLHVVGMPLLCLVLAVLVAQFLLAPYIRQRVPNIH